MGVYINSTTLYTDDKGTVYQCVKCNDYIMPPLKTRPLAESQNNAILVGVSDFTHIEILALHKFIILISIYYLALITYLCVLGQ